MTTTELFFVEFFAATRQGDPSLVLDCSLIIYPLANITRMSVQ